jgi:aminopeptidase-like protein
MTLLWVLNLADGRHTLLDMAERAGQPFAAVRAAADAAVAAGLLVPADPPPAGEG